MVKGGIPFRETVAAPGSDLHKAITEGNLKLANQIYELSTQRMLALTTPKEIFEDIPF